MKGRSRQLWYAALSVLKIRCSVCAFAGRVNQNAPSAKLGQQSYWRVMVSIRIGVPPLADTTVPHMESLTIWLCLQPTMNRNRSCLWKQRTQADEKWKERSRH